MLPDAHFVTLHHGTTLRRARDIEANGPNPRFQEPGEYTTAEGFSTCLAGATHCAGGLPDRMARDKAANFRGDGGPAILEVVVPGWIMNILYADQTANFMARGGEIRFEPESGLNELRAGWKELPKRVIPL